MMYYSRKHSARLPALSFSVSHIEVCNYICNVAGELREGGAQAVFGVIHHRSLYINLFNNETNAKDSKEHKEKSSKTNDFATY